MAKKVYTKKELEAMKVGELRKLSIFKKLNLYNFKKAEAIEAILNSQEKPKAEKPKAINKPIEVKIEANIKQVKKVVENKQENSKSNPNLFKRFKLKISNITFR